MTGNGRSYLLYADLAFSSASSHFIKEFHTLQTLQTVKNERLPWRTLKSEADGYFPQVVSFCYDLSLFILSIPFSQPP